MSFLEDILERKRTEVEGHRRAQSEGDLAILAASRPPPLPFYDALSSCEGPTRIIAEVKRASPSAGAINNDLDAPAQAKQYEDSGAVAVSVLTDGPGFGGSLADLAEIRDVVEVPLLRKDFIFDRYQMLEACICGADAVLLIVAAVRDDLERLLAAAVGLGLGVIVEVHDEEELDVALTCGAQIVGINNRDLKTFDVDLETTLRLLPRIPKTVKVVAESGIRTPEDAARLRDAGVTNMLIGEALVRASKVPGADLSAFLHSLTGTP